MATIYGISGLTFSFPEERRRVFVGARDRASDGTYKTIETRNRDKQIVIYLKLLTQATLDSLQTALEGATNGQGAITPDANINLGNGAGVAVNAQWLDAEFAATRNSPYWDLALNFMYLS